MSDINRMSRRSVLKLLGSMAAAGTLNGVVGARPLFNVNRLQATQVLNMLSHSSPQTESYRRTGEAFQAMTGYSLNITEVPFNELQVKMMTELLAQTGAYDLFPITNAMMYPAAPYLEDIGGLFDDELVADLSPSSVENVRDLQGILRGMPMLNSTPANFYRTDLIEAAGLTAPTNWDEYLEVAKALTIEPTDGSPKIWGTLLEGSARAVQPGFKLVSWLYQAGGGLADENLVPTVNSEANVTALQYVVDLVNVHQVAPPETAEMIYEDVHNLFIQGRGGTAINWQYMVGLGNNPELSVVPGKFAVAPLPAGVQNGAVIDHWLMVVPKDSPNKEAALQYVEFAVTKERQQDLLVSEGLVARFSAMDPSDPVVQQANPFIDAWLEQMQWAKPLPKWAQINNVMLRLSVALNTAITMAATPQQALDEAQAEIVQMVR
ncbi:MAG: sugar ABC transporter substrate-binding protein [Anaerolineae bacterium]|nr:sugar ABC transporter substrate-binding protein [Anaerolineae bacterium]